MHNHQIRNGETRFWFNFRGDFSLHGFLKPVWYFFLYLSITRNFWTTKRALFLTHRMCRVEKWTTFACLCVCLCVCVGRVIVVSYHFDARVKLCIVFSRKQTNLHSTIALRNLISIARLLPLFFLSVSQTKLVYSRNIYCHSTTLHYPLLNFKQHNPRFVWPFLSAFHFAEKDVQSKYNDYDDKVQTVLCKNLALLTKKFLPVKFERKSARYRGSPSFTKNTSQFGWSAYPFARIFLYHCVL